MRRCLLILALALTAHPAWAQVSNFRVDTTTGATGNGAVVSNVLSIDFVNIYSGSQILVELTSGRVNQETFDILGAPVNPDTAPSRFVLDNFPNVNFDTYIAQGDVAGDGPNARGPAALGGGAINIRIDEITAVFNDATKISQSFNPAGSEVEYDFTGFVVARLSFTADANGTFTYFGAASHSPTAFFFTREGGVIGGADLYEIRNGAIVPVPEPALAALLGLGGLAALRRR